MSDQELRDAAEAIVGFVDRDPEMTEASEELLLLIDAMRPALTQPTTEPPTDSSQDSPANPTSERESARPIILQDGTTELDK